MIPAQDSVADLMAFAMQDDNAETMSDKDFGLDSSGDSSDAEAPINPMMSFKPITTDDVHDVMDFDPTLDEVTAQAMSDGEPEAEAEVPAMAAETPPNYYNDISDDSSGDEAGDEAGAANMAAHAARLAEDEGKALPPVNVKRKVIIDDSSDDEAPIDPKPQPKPRAKKPRRKRPRQSDSTFKPKPDEGETSQALALVSTEAGMTWAAKDADNAAIVTHINTVWMLLMLLADCDNFEFTEEPSEEGPVITPERTATAKPKLANCLTVAGFTREVVKKRTCHGSNTYEIWTLNGKHVRINGFDYKTSTWKNMFETLRVLFLFVDAMNTASTSSIVKPTILLITLIRKMDVSVSVKGIINECVNATGPQISPSEVWPEGPAKGSTLAVCFNRGTKVLMNYISNHLVHTNEAGVSAISAKDVPRLNDAAYEVIRHMSNSTVKQAVAAAELTAATIRKKAFADLNEADEEIKALRETIERLEDDMKKAQTVVANTTQAMSEGGETLAFFAPRMNPTSRAVVEAEQKKLVEQVAEATATVENIKNKQKAAKEQLRNRVSAREKAPPKKYGSWTK